MKKIVLPNFLALLMAFFFMTQSEKIKVAFFLIRSIQSKTKSWKYKIANFKFSAVNTKRKTFAYCVLHCTLSTVISFSLKKQRKQFGPWNGLISFMATFSAETTSRSLRATSGTFDWWHSIHSFHKVSYDGIQLQLQFLFCFFLCLIHTWRRFYLTFFDKDRR